MANVPVHPAPASPAAPGTTAQLASADREFDARWNAWIARGLAGEAATRRRMRIAVPVIVAMAAAILVVFY